MIDTDGTKTLSRRAPNNEAEPLKLMGDVPALAEDAPATWAVDHRSAAQIGSGVPSERKQAKTTS
ncbi:hypothetical protein OH735_23695 [Streptomyces sp. NBC_01618]|nr:hypothetical protein OH735_23695 [Streptomyces sp. NBC_01618]